VAAGKILRVITLHSIRVRVYYEDTDAGGIVYYANYLRYFERARTDWLRTVGVSQRELSQVEGLNLVVRDCAVQYLRPARLDDLLVVEVGLANPAIDIGRASLRFTQRALLTEGGTVLATGTVRVACVDLRAGRPVALPERVMAMVSRQVSMKVPMQDSIAVTAQVSTQVTPDGTAEQQ
jgi:acyl-CoA thioester hydrolase